MLINQLSLHHNLLNFTKILSNSNVLILDDSDELKKIYSSSYSNSIVNLDLCKVNEISLFTKNNYYLNYYDNIICPDLFFKDKLKNRYELIKIFAWLLKSGGSLTIAIPDYRIFNLQYDDLVISQEKEYYVVRQKGILSYLFYNKEYYYKRWILDPIYPFSHWNITNNKCKWKIEPTEIRMSKIDNFILFDIKIEKEFSK